MARSKSCPGRTPSDVGWKFSSMALVEGRVVVCLAHTEQSTWRPAAKGPGWGRRRAQPVDDLGNTGEHWGYTGVPQEGSVVHKPPAPNAPLGVGPPEASGSSRNVAVHLPSRFSW